MPNARLWKYGHVHGLLLLEIEIEIEIWVRRPFGPPVLILPPRAAPGDDIDGMRDLARARGLLDCSSR